MLRSILNSRVFWISFLAVVSGCASRAPSLRLLDTRAAYNSPYDDEEVAIYQRARLQGNSIGRAAGPRIVKVYVYAHELPSQDYFWGGYISLVVRRDEVIFESPSEEESSERGSRKGSEKLLLGEERR